MALPVPIRPTTTGARGRNIANPSGGTPQDVGYVTATITDIPDIKDEDLKNWVETLYDVTKFNDDDIKGMWESFSYKGFSRNDILKQLAVRIKDKRICVELIVVSALRGPQASSRIKLSNGRTAIDMGIPASGGQGVKTLTMNKIQAATADLAAYFLKKMNTPKRMDIDLPGWLQFPSAGGIKMPENYRERHLEFSKKFSTLIGGVFQEQIYMQMRNNAYLDPKLNLFS